MNSIGTNLFVYIYTYSDPDKLDERVIATSVSQAIEKFANAPGISRKDISTIIKEFNTGYYSSIKVIPYFGAIEKPEPDIEVNKENPEKKTTPDEKSCKDKECRRPTFKKIKLQDSDIDEDIIKDLEDFGNLLYILKY